MPKHLVSLVLLTFVTGFASGVYVFFTTRDTASNVPTPQKPEKGYEILVTVYGGCERVGCASFRLLDDGSYQYLAPESVRDYARHEDTITERQRTEITDLLNETDLEDVSDSEFIGTCPAAYDGLAYRFDIQKEGMRYSYDSCMEDLDGQALFIELIKYFAIMEATYRSS